MSEVKTDDKRKKYKDEIVKILSRTHIDGKRKEVIDLALLIGFGSLGLRVVQLNEVFSRAYGDFKYDKSEIEKIANEALAELESQD